MYSFNVTFLGSRGIQSKKLKGDGVITVSEDEVVLTRSEVRGWFWNTPEETVTVEFKNIANVIYNEEEQCVQFSEYCNGVYSGTPVNVYKFIMDNPLEQNVLFALLPKQASEEVTMEAEFNNKLKQLTPYAIWTYAIVAICVIICIAMGVFYGFKALDNPSGIVALRFGADYGPLVVDGEWYRIITCAFVHFGIVHVAFNMMILLQIGNFVERLYGNMLFLVVYLGSAVAGSLMSLTMNPAVITAGASGAIFGLYGALLAYMFRRRGAIPLHMITSIRNGAILFIAFSLLCGMAPGIDNWCHLGGLLGGFFLGVIVAPPFESEERTRYIFIMSILGAAIVIAGAFLYLSSDSIKLKQKKIGDTLTELGICYHNGNSVLHVKKDINAAIDYYCRAMKYNNPVAIYTMAVMYRDGVGVEKDEEKAFELLKQAAELDLLDAQSEYGRILYFEKKNKKEGFDWLKKAGDRGAKTARFRLACIYYTGDENTKPDRDLAVNMLKRLAKVKYQPAVDLLNKLEKDVPLKTSNSVNESAPVENAGQGGN